MLKAQRYTDWAQVIPPRATPSFGNPTQALDFQRFSSDELLDCFRFVPLWTYAAYLRNLVVLPPSGRIPSEHFLSPNQSDLENVS